MARTVTMRPKKRGQKRVSFKKGGLHRSLGVPEGDKIPDDKMRSAKAGNYGEKARKQASMAMGMLAKGRKTSRKKRGGGRS